MRVRLLVSLALIPLFLSACSGPRTLDPRTWFSRDTAASGAAPRELPGVEARLKPIGSALNGVVRARESGDLLIVRVELSNLPQGMYRVVFHANGNCSSPNGFSAGEQWLPPGAKGSPARLVPEIYTNSAGDAIVTARLRGVRLGGEGGLEKRGVLVYEGANTDPPRPNVPNGVVACGVFERSTALFGS
ncbi:MAG TPA: superoxide dismutase family protein [Casimicrobiaceae bacterium]|nr:superoxide dismutase family protein [Casimicrobiaceae bacterium]